MTARSTVTPGPWSHLKSPVYRSSPRAIRRGCPPATWSLAWWAGTWPREAHEAPVLSGKGVCVVCAPQVSPYRPPWSQAPAGPSLVFSPQSPGAPLLRERRASPAAGTVGARFPRLLGLPERAPRAARCPGRWVLSGLAALRVNTQTPHHDWPLSPLFQGLVRCQSEESRWGYG